MNNTATRRTAETTTLTNEGRCAEFTATDGKCLGFATRPHGGATWSLSTGNSMTLLRTATTLPEAAGLLELHDLWLQERLNGW